MVLAILDTVHRSWTTAAIPAAVRVTSRSGAPGVVAAPAVPWGLPTLHGRAVLGSNCIIDHLVIGPAGVFAVDSNAGTGGCRYGPPRAASCSTARTARPATKHAQLEAGEAARLISADLGRTILVRPAMVIYGLTVPWTVARISGGSMCSAAERLRRVSGARAPASRAQRLERPDVQRIADAAERALPRR